MCYNLFKGPLSYHAAKEQCIQLTKEKGHSSLATVKTLKTHNFLINIIASVHKLPSCYDGADCVWIGLETRASPPTTDFFWVDGTPLSNNTFWNPGPQTGPPVPEPTPYDGETAVQTNFGGLQRNGRLWNNRHPISESHYMCQMKIYEEIITVVE